MVACSSSPLQGNIWLTIWNKCEWTSMLARLISWRIFFNHIKVNFLRSAATFHHDQDDQWPWALQGHCLGKGCPNKWWPLWASDPLRFNTFRTCIYINHPDYHQNLQDLKTWIPSRVLNQGLVWHSWQPLPSSTSSRHSIASPTSLDKTFKTYVNSITYLGIFWSRVDVPEGSFFSTNINININMKGTVYCLSSYQMRAMDYSNCWIRPFIHLVTDVRVTTLWRLRRSWVRPTCRSRPGLARGRSPWRTDLFSTTVTSSGINLTISPIIIIVPSLTKSSYWTRRYRDEGRREERERSPAVAFDICGAFDGDGNNVDENGPPVLIWCSQEDCDYLNEKGSCLFVCYKNDLFLHMNDEKYALHKRTPQNVPARTVSRPTIQSRLAARRGA